MHLKFQRKLFPPILVCVKGHCDPYNLNRMYFSVSIPLCADGDTKGYAKKDVILK